ncbi:dynactin subunit 3 [Anaeramoeba ignava]|uniref:Dynactin subunit 3 n=1 Tax=Anaeramoeba ignava TaxID=1746090 RepID=A0A9Q0RA87_ANAIG|nr:dynactin subunit 3 [Anaeramoeba ignava]
MSNNLQERLNALKEFIGVIPKEMDSNENLVNWLAVLLQELQELEEHFPIISEFALKLNQYKDLLKKEKTSKSDLNLQTRLQLLQSYEEMINETINGLKQINDLENIIDVSAKEDTTQNVSELQKLDSKFLSQFQQSNNLDLELDKSLESYNQILDLISDKFLELDTILKLVEKN